MNHEPMDAPMADMDDELDREFRPRVAHIAVGENTSPPTVNLFEMPLLWHKLLGVMLHHLKFDKFVVTPAMLESFAARDADSSDTVITVSQEPGGGFVLRLLTHAEAVKQGFAK